MIVPALLRESLVKPTWDVGMEAEGDPSSFSVHVRPTSVGAELFLWGHVHRPPNASQIVDRSVDLTFLSEVPATPNVTPLTQPEG